MKKGTSLKGIFTVGAIAIVAVALFNRFAPASVKAFVQGA